MTSYEVIFNAFLRKIEDIELAERIQLDEESAIEDMIGWLHSAVAHLGYLEHDTLTFNDEEMQFEEDLTDVEVEFYALGVRVEWLESIVKRRGNFMQMFGGKEEKFYSQASHLATIESSLKNDKLEIKKYKRDYGYLNNSYISGDSR